MDVHRNPTVCFRQIVSSQIDNCNFSGASDPDNGGQVEVARPK